MDKSEQEILQRHLAKFIAGEVFDTITEDDIFKKDTAGILTYKGQLLAPGVAELISKEALAFSKTGLFQMLQDEMRWHAKEAHNRATTENDLIVSKILSYFVDVFKTKVKKLSELAPQKPLPADARKGLRRSTGR